MNVLLIGSGGRENALAYKISQSKTLNKLFMAPGNPGTKHLGENVSIRLNDFNVVYDYCVNNEIKLVVVGPEQPLVQGISDYLRERGIKVFGPDKAAAEIEAHKSFAKKLMSDYGIPTAAYAEFNSGELNKAKDYLKVQKFPCVVKADGLAAGKGVLICNDLTEAEKAIEEIFINKIFGSSGDKLIIEEFMKGEEASIFAITDGDGYVCLPSAQDHKRIGNNDTGKNTGGMGAYSPAPIVTSEILNEVEEKIIKPTLKGLKKENRKFIGCLYCGLMLTDKGVKVVEYNCRFGDPETQAVLPLLDGDFLKLLYSAADGKLDKEAVKYTGGSAVCVVAASKGYPDSYDKGFEISGLQDVEEGIIVFHAGTKEADGKVLTNGGRVLGVTAVVKSNNLKLAKEAAYRALSNIHFEGIYYRTDIADKALMKKVMYRKPDSNRHLV